MSLQQFVNYRKLGGFLMAVFVLSIISIVFSAIGIFTIMATKDIMMRTVAFFTPGYYLYTLATSAISIITSLAFVILLGKRNRNFIYVYIFSVGVGLVTTIISYTVFSTVMAATNTNIITTITSLGLSIALIVYFFKSSRVKVYSMNNNDYNQEYMRLRQQWEMYNMQAQQTYGQQPPVYGQQPPMPPQ